MHWWGWQPNRLCNFLSRLSTSSAASFCKTWIRAWPAAAGFGQQHHWRLPWPAARGVRSAAPHVFARTLKALQCMRKHMALPASVVLTVVWPSCANTMPANEAHVGNGEILELAAASRAASATWSLGHSLECGCGRTLDLRTRTHM